MTKLSNIWLVRSDLDIPDNTDSTPGFNGAEQRALFKLWISKN